MFVSIIGFNIISDRLEYVSVRLGVEIMSKTGFAPVEEGNFYYILRIFLKMVNQTRQLYWQKY